MEPEKSNDHPLVKLGPGGDFTRELSGRESGAELLGGSKAFVLEREVGRRGSGVWVEVASGLSRYAARLRAEGRAGAGGGRHAVVCTDPWLPFPRREVFWASARGVERRVEV